MADEVLNQFTQAVEEKKAAGRKVKFGIIGTGWIAESHVRYLKQMDDVEIVAMADLIPGKAEKFAEKFGVSGCRFYPSHKELIDNEQLDAVCVCTYNATHKECAVYALDHGINVMLEKPMSVTTEEAAEICRAEKRSGKTLVVGFQPRMDENMKMVKKIVQSGVLGKIYYIQTGGGRRRGIPNSTFIEKKTAGIGALGDIGCYSLDMVLNAIGYPKPLTVTGYTSNYFGTNPKYNNPADAARFDVDDFAAAFVRLEGDIILDFRIAWAMHIDSPGDTIFLGTEGALRVPATDCWNGPIGGPMTVYHDVAGERVETKIPMKGNSDKGIFYLKLRSFIETFRDGAETPVNSHDILYNQAIIDYIGRSQQAGKELVVEIPEI